MAPNQREDVTLTHDSLEKSKSHVRAGKYSIVWRNLISVLIYHLAAVYGVYLSFTTASWKTIFFCCLTYYLSIIGITAGAHRLWSHRSYKAKLPLQIFLMLCQSLAGQVSIHEWARDHRVHHKHSDTDADPYNASRGLFFSHVGWTMVKKHPEVKAKGALIDMSDLNENPVVMFQKRHEKWFVILVAHIIPTLLPVYFWNESLHVSFSLNMLRYALSLNAIWSVNSFAHKFGSKPYDKTLFPTENFLANLISLGEGFHNYHHTFPYDYNAGEMGKMMNFSSSFIDFCAWTGLAYDRKTVSNDVLEMRMKRTGDEYKMAPKQRDDVTLTYDSFEMSKSRVKARNYKILWRNVVVMSVIHLTALNGFYLSLSTASWKTICFCCLTYYLSIIGVTAGAHRLWSHRSYKAKLPLQIFLMLCQTLACQNTIYQWARDHRVHHKHSDTDADPHNANRGFFFSHVGWLLVKKHPEVANKGGLIDLSDLHESFVVMFQKRNEKLLVVLIAYTIPTLVPIYLWNELFSVSLCLNMLRMVLALNGILCINSFAHKFGNKPYDKTIYPTENGLVTFLTFGEGFHNYHHTFPYDYNAGELGKFMNFSSSFIDFCAWVGLAYDRKTVSNDVLEMRINRTGDGTRK